MKSELESKVYTEHLTRVNKQNKIISSEDIFNEKGVLLLKKNSVIDSKASLQVAKHKLKKSIAVCVTFESTLNEKQLYSAFQALFENHPDISQMHSHFQLNSDLQKACLFANKFPLLMQQLTVMQLNLPVLFDKSVMGAWFSLAVARQLEFDGERTNQVFLAALVRDIGFMHIESEALDAAITAAETRELDEKAWRQIQSHVLIGKLLLDNIDGLPVLVKQALLEHHERCDGAGYPRAKQAPALSLAGQVVAIADAIQAILSNRLKDAGQNVANLEGFLTLNMSTYGEDIYRAVVRLIRRSDCNAKSTVGLLQFPAYIEKLLVTNKAFWDLCHSLYQLLPELQAGTAHKETLLLINFIKRIQTMQARTGVPSQEYARWLEYVQKNEVEQAYPEIELLGAMFEELAWQLTQIGNYVTLLSRAESISDAFRSKLEDVSLQLKNLP